MDTVYHKGLANKSLTPENSRVIVNGDIQVKLVTWY